MVRGRADRKERVMEPLNEITESLEAMAETMRALGDHEKASGVESALWLIEELENRNKRADLISRCDLFNRLATVQAETANEMKGKVYAIIQEMPTAGE